MNKIKSFPHLPISPSPHLHNIKGIDQEPTPERGAICLLKWYISLQQDFMSDKLKGVLG